MADEECNWSDLPSELLKLVMMHLPTGLLLTTTTQVCRSWRAASVACPLLYLSPVYRQHWADARLGLGVMAAAHKAPLARLVCTRSSWLHTIVCAESDAVQPKTTAAAIATATQLTALDLTFTEVVDEDVDAIAKACTKLEVLRLGKCERLTNASVDALKSCRMLQQLTLSHCSVTGHAIARVGKHLEKLTHLHMSGITTLNDAHLSVVAARCERMEVLDVSGCLKIGDESCFALANCKRLRKINLSHTLVTEKGLASLAQGCSQLAELTLVQARGVKALPPTPTPTPTPTPAAGRAGLTLLNISQVSGISAAAAEQIAADHPFLQHLSVCGGLAVGGVRRRGPELSSAALLAWSTMSALAVIDLSWCAELTDEMLAQLQPPQLTSLDLSVTLVGTAGLSALSQNCQGLQVLKLADCLNVSDAGLEFVGSACLKLAVLDVSECAQVGDNGLAHIAKGCAQLRTLDCSDCEQISDAGIAGILDLCESLRELKVAETDVTDTILANADRASIEVLDVHQCDNLAPESIFRFVATQRNLRVLNIYYCRKLPVAVRDQLVAMYPGLTVHHQGSMG